MGFLIKLIVYLNTRKLLTDFKLLRDGILIRKPGFY